MSTGSPPMDECSKSDIVGASQYRLPHIMCRKLQTITNSSNIKINMRYSSSTYRSLSDCEEEHQITTRPSAVHSRASLTQCQKTQPHHCRRAKLSAGAHGEYNTTFETASLSVDLRSGGGEYHDCFRCPLFCKPCTLQVERDPSYRPSLAKQLAVLCRGVWVWRTRA